MKNIYYLALYLCLIASMSLQAQGAFSAFHVYSEDKPILSEGDLSKVKQYNFANTIRSPWRAERMNYFEWWSKKVGLRIIESFKFQPGVRYFHQKSRLEYLADETVFGGEITIDDDLLNSVNLPSVIENRLRDLRIELPEGILSREVVNWASLAQAEVTLLGISIRGRYWSGALAPEQFPQPKNVKALFDREELIEVAAREIAATSALNNAVSLEVAIHPIQLLTGFRNLEWSGESGFYFGGDASIGWIKSTDLTFKQGRELLGDIDMGEEIRDVLPDPLESLINTDEAGDLLLVAAESRLPLYGFGLPIASGRIFEIEGWAGFTWSNKTWSGDARIGFVYQSQNMSNEHPSMPTLVVHRWTPTIRMKWVFNKEETKSALFSE